MPAKWSEEEVEICLDGRWMVIMSFDLSIP